MNSIGYLTGHWYQSNGEGKLKFNRADSSDRFNVEYHPSESNEILNEDVDIYVTNRIEKNEILFFAGGGALPRGYLRILDENNIVLWDVFFTRVIAAQFSI